MPIVLIFISQIVNSLKDKRFIQVSLLTFITLLISVGFYLSYPRYDNVYATHGRNVSIYDFKAAEFINKTASEPYVVLASQNTSVAAVKLFGFGPVYNENFYYPIPTGSELYQYFLKMVNDQPKTEYINKVKNITGVQTVYFVLPEYWNNFDNLKQQAKTISKESHSIDNHIYIFKY